MIHLTVQQLSSYLDRQLVGAASDNVQSHLAACRDCATRFALLERIEGVLSEVLSIDPGDAFFQELEAEVGSRIRERGQRDRDLTPPVVSSVRYLEPPVPFRASEHRSPTSAGRVAAPGRAAAGRAASNGRAASSGRVARHGAVRRSGPSSAWIIIALLAVISGSMGVVVSRTPLVSSLLATYLGLGAAERSVAARVLSPDAPPETSLTSPSVLPPPADSTPAGHGSERRDWYPWEPPSAHSSTTDDEMAPDVEPQTPEMDIPDRPEPSTMRGDEVLVSPDSSRRSRAASSDPFRALGAESLGPVRAAQQLSEMADADPTAARFEAAADGWERALDTMGGVPEQVSVRRLLADALYRAWEAEPTRARAEAAKSSIKTYLLFAPSGWEREEAKGRLTRLGG